MSTEPTTPTGDLKTAVQHSLRLLSKGEVGMAREQAEEILRHYPDEVNSRFVVAAALRAQGHHDDALSRLEALTRQAPDFALAQQELGFAYARAGRLYPAIEALQSALRVQDGLPASWKLMGELFLTEGDEKSANEAFRRHLLASNEDPNLVQAIDLFRKGRYGQAERLCRDYLYENPNNVTAIRLLAEIGIKIGVYVDAERLLKRCLELAPDFSLARLNYANVLSKREKLEEALAEVDRLLAAEPDKPAYLAQRASILVRMGRFDDAIAAYEHLLGNFPAQPKIALSYGHALKTIGRQEDAIAAYRRAIDLRPEFGDGYWSLANLKTFRFEDEQIDAMRRKIDEAGLPVEDRFHLCFALGKALDDRERCDEAFRYYETGNRIKQKLEGYSADTTEAIGRNIRSVCDRTLFAGERGCPAPDPVFIVGLPRSGSTLLEQILSSHSLVDGTKELIFIPAMVRRLGGRKKNQQESRYPAVLADLDGGTCADLGEEYLANTAIQRGSAPYFIDKMPNNFFHLGLISLILPNASIIDARRHPIAACFSCFTQLFASGQPFTYGLENIGRYYREYVELMDHWDTVLPGKVLRVQYEDVVTDTEAQVRCMLEHCGLPFEEQCLAFYETGRAVRTASSEQVRQPIYRGALEHWRQYEEHLDELKDALGPVLERYPPA